MSHDSAQRWLDLQCRMISGVRRAILLLNPVGGEADRAAASWPDAQQDTALLAESGRLALRNKAPVVRPTPGAGGGPIVVACPICQGDRLLGAVALEFDSLDQNQQQTLLQLLGWSAAWLELISRDDGSQRIAADLATVVEITARSLEHASMREAVTATITRLAGIFACDRVSFGEIRDRRVGVEAISGSAQLDRRTALVQTIQAAMEEALDEHSTLTHPPIRSTDTPRLPAHERLCAASGDAAACTVLLVVDGSATGALTFERRAGPAFDQATIDLFEALGALLAPIIELKRLNDRPLPAKLADDLRGALGGLFGPRNLRRKLLFIALTALGIALGLVQGDFRVSATAVLEGTEQRALVAPIDGYVQRAHARAGELVRKGDLIAELDDRELELQLRRWASERDDLGKRLGRAIGSFDRAEAAVIEAQLGKAKARHALIEEQLQRTRIVAPIDGVIVSGDLSRSLGAPVERGQVLFELSPLDGFRMALQVAESDIGHVRRGQRGHLALSALPGERLAFVVEDIIGVARTEAGQNGFRVEARLEEPAARLRPGMHGVGKIAIEKRSLLWIWSHDVLERVGLWLWSHLP